MHKPELIPISSLQLDLINQRLPEGVNSQHEAIKAIAELQREKLVNLAKHIVDHGLRPAVAVMDEPPVGFPLVNRLLKGIEREVDAHRARYSPADDQAREDIDHESHVHRASPSGDIGEIRHPELVRAVGFEGTLDHVQRPLAGEIGRDGGARPLPASNDAMEASVAHEPLDGAACDTNALSPELAPHLPRSVHRAVLLPDAPDIDRERLVSLGSLRTESWIGFSRLMGVVGGRSTRQHLADRLDSVLTTVEIF